MPRIDTTEIDLERSMDFDKEHFLNDLVDNIHTTREEFDRLYVLEEHPMDVTMLDYSDHALGFSVDMPVQYVFITRQEFHIRRKTPEEMATDVSHHITQGVN